MNKVIFHKNLLKYEKPKYFQVFYMPVKVISFFLFSRLARLFKHPVFWKSKTFWNHKIYGYIPDPSFSSIYLYGFSDPGLTEMLLYNVKRNMVCFDVGAHIGYESVLMSQLVGQNGVVYSFEPTSNTYRLLLQNTSTSKNVVPLNIALWSKNTIKKISDYGLFDSGINSFYSPRVRSGEKKKNIDKVDVVCFSMDSYCTMLKIFPDFIKIDAESAEYDILLGMKNILSKVKPIIVLEIGDLPNMNGQTKKIISLLSKYGYNPYEYKDGRIVKHKMKRNYSGIYNNLMFKVV